MLQNKKPKLDISFSIADFVLDIPSNKCSHPSCLLRQQQEHQEPWL